MEKREKLRQRFNRRFAHWNIELPVDAMSPGKVWLIVERGWTIWTRFHVDAEDGREHLHCFSTHRMTNDSHVRLYVDGETENLAAIAHGYSYPKDATEAEIEAAQERFLAHNQAVEKLLEEKGFVMTDEAHPSAQINRYLQTRPDAGDVC